MLLARGALVASLVVGAATAQQERFDQQALWARMSALDWWYRPPVPGERCVQWSSFDRAAKDGPRNPAAWYANDDRGKYVRTVTRDGVAEHVLVDAVGPGAVARIWSANPSGTLHFDVDGARVWSVDFAALCNGRVDGVAEPFAGIRARGGTVYLPIPFARSLVVAATAADLYYAVDVVQWPAGTPVAPFDPQRLAGSAEPRPPFAHERIGPYNTEIWFPVRRHPVGRGQVVVQITVSFDEALPRADQVEILRHTLLVVRCGDEETVRVPAADFFALGSAANPFSGRCLSVTADRAVCTFPMPMPDGGSIELVPELDYGKMGPKLLRVQCEPLAAKDPLLFRAHYHLAKATRTRPFSDHLVLDAVGTGRFVGCSLLVRNPVRIWWGEGDEKITVDGEAFPSWFGTGTEDYFGYAWCDPTQFSAPFHAQVECQGPGNFGFTQLHRTHALDAVPFQRSFRFELERWHWIEDVAIDYATVAYWYGAADATARMPQVPDAVDRQLDRLDSPEVFVAKDALEGEALRVVSCSGGRHEVQDLSVLPNTFSRDAHRWWRDGKVGDALVLAVPVPERGRYRVVAGFVEAIDFATVQCSLGGNRIGAPFDGYAPRIAASGPVELGVVDLQSLEVELRLELVGKHADAKPGMMVGLDWLRLEAVR